MLNTESHSLVLVYGSVSKKQKPREIVSWELLPGLDFAALPKDITHEFGS